MDLVRICSDNSRINNNLIAGCFSLFVNCVQIACTDADDKAHEAELSCDQVAMDSATNDYQLNLEHNTSPAECSKHCLIEHKYNASSWSSCTTTYTKRVAVV